jgi:serine/threonine protein kinase
LGKNSGKKLVEILDSSYPNPLVLVERLVRQSRDLSVATVHGDLHPSNVVYDFRKTPHLIDFSWCRQNAHILQDFLVMECSVRFLMSSRGLSPKQQSATDSALLARTVDPDSIAGRLEKSGVPKPTRDRVARSTKIVNCLRDQAAKACGEGFTISDYLACQALVLYGLCRVKEYPFLTCINALGLIGRQLDKIGYVQ